MTKTTRYPNMKMKIISLLAVAGFAGVLSFAKSPPVTAAVHFAQEQTPVPPPAPLPQSELERQEPDQQDPRRKAPDELQPGKDCLDCHAEVSSEKHVHRPIRWGNCKLCHIQSEPLLHRFTPPKDMGAVCNECHLLPERNSMHAPVRNGECLSCHKPHQSEQRYLMRLSKETDLCGQCHIDQVGTNKKFVHGPVAIGACSLCHMPHSSTRPKLLRPEKETACLNCHTEMAKRLAPPNTVHPPVKENCAQCHDPHASDHRYQLRSEQKVLCMDCHRPMIDELEAKPVYHEALRTEESCAYCHDVHASPYPKMLKKPVLDLCMSCHDKPILHEDGTELKGMGDTLRNSAHLHGPVNEGNCAACHDPHGSVTFSLLRDAYPKTFYAPWKKESYALCFRCHDAAAFMTVETDTLTGFRNGDRNLHFLHVNNDTKGRTCRACHDTHGSDRPLHITEGVPFGSWEIPINFEKTASGGSCSPGCHVEKAYDRITPVQRTLQALLPRSPQATQKP